MKLPFTIYDLRFTIWKKSARSLRRSPLVTRHSSLVTRQSGVALIITLILLAVVTFMALTFLAISRRERGAVTTATDTASAKLAADDALAAAEAQIVANVARHHQSLQLRPARLDQLHQSQRIWTGVANFTNVNYYYYQEWRSRAPIRSRAMIFSKTLPICITSRARRCSSDQCQSERPVDFRFYLDLNRNGYLRNQRCRCGRVAGPTIEVGDPEWVGVLQHPDQPYGPNNPFVARYAFIAVPIGNALDLNAIYNDAMGIKGNLGMGRRQ